MASASRWFATTSGIRITGRSASERGRFTRIKILGGGEEAGDGETAAKMISNGNKRKRRTYSCCRVGSARAG